MFEFFDAIGNFLGSIVSFITNLISSVLELFKWMGIALEYVSQLAAYVPASLLGIAMAFITVSVVYLIAGR